LPALLFDLDGTLTDPREGIIRCLRHAFAEIGAAVPSDAEMEQCIGPPLRDGLRCLLPGDELADRALASFRGEYGRAGLLENRIYPGVEDALRSLHESRATMFVATSKPQTFAQRTIEHFGLGRFFRAVYGCGFDGTFAEKSELLRHLIAQESLDPDDTFMIGDRKYDVIAARENGIGSVAVLWGFGSAEELSDADAFCASPADLIGVLERLPRSGRGTPL
jgi:phosphoglycolate phosphatase